MEILEKVAYLKGLAEGLGLDTEKREGKLLSVIIDVLEDMALEIRDILGLGSRGEAPEVPDDMELPDTPEAPEPPPPPGRPNG